MTLRLESWLGINDETERRLGGLCGRVGGTTVNRKRRERERAGGYLLFLSTDGSYNMCVFFPVIFFFRSFLPVSLLAT